MTLFSKLRELEKKATQGKWFHSGSLTEEECSKAGGLPADLVTAEFEEDAGGMVEEVHTASLLDPISDSDAEFIAELKRALPKIFEVLDLYESGLNEAKEWIRGERGSLGTDWLSALEAIEEALKRGKEIENG